MHLKLSRTIVFGILLFSLSPTLAKSSDRTQTRIETASQAALRTSVMLRLDRTDATDTDASDRGSETVIRELVEVVNQYENRVSKLRNSADSEEVEEAKVALEDILLLLPKTNRAFERVVETDSATAPKLIAGLRRIILRALHISTSRAELRVHALELIIERMQLHAELAGGRQGVEFLSTFSVWLAELSGWRYVESDSGTKKRIDLTSVTPYERERIAVSDKQYRMGFDAMMCARLFTSAPTKRASR